jgi:hypothetical protein
MSQQVMSPEKQMSSNAPMISAPVAPSGEHASFSDENRQAFRQEDYGAARIIVGIMASVFTMGLAIYIFIAYLVASGGH